MAKKKIYKLLYCFEAPDLLKSKKTGVLVTEYFNKGEVVIGEYFEKKNIIVEDRYIIPIKYLEESKEFPYLKKDSKFDETIERIKQQAVHLSNKDKNGINDFGENVKNVVEGKTKVKITEESKAYRNGALLGLGSSVLLALYLRKNIWIFALLGIAIGGYVSHKIHQAKKGNNTV